MPLIASTRQTFKSARLFILLLAAFATGLPMAWVSLSKFLVVVAGLVCLVTASDTDKSTATWTGLYTPWMVLTVLFTVASSLLWTVAPLNLALDALVKHGKLVEILVLILLLRTQDEARVVLLAFFAGQFFLLASSWLMVIGVRPPWVTSHDQSYAVFSTYLDQSIIFATSAAIVWHLRSERLWPRWLGVIFVVAALGNTLLFLRGRTGYLVATAMISIGVMWALPKRWRLLSLVVVPSIVIAGLIASSAQVRARLSEVVTESHGFQEGADYRSSSGWRLNAWQRSIQAMQESPWAGVGVGGWTQTVKRLQGPSATEVFGREESSNPHQEYLLWGVELGVGGTMLFVALLICLMGDARRFSPPVARSLTSVTVALAISALFNSILYDGLIGDYFCVCIGLLMALGVRSSQKD